MFTGPALGSHGRSAGKRSNVVFVSGFVIVVVTLLAIGAMFTTRPITSEEEEIASRAYTRAREAMREEWVDAEVECARRGGSTLLLDRPQLLRLYRLRVFLVVAEAEVSRLSRVLESLVKGNYTGRVFPIDVEMHVLGSAASVPSVAWPHGRLDVYAHHHGRRDADLSVSHLMSHIWQPQSDFELGLLLTATTHVSPHWFQWVMGALWRYAATSPETFFELARGSATEAGGGRLLSPLSTTLSGLALGLPVAGAAATSAVMVLAADPSPTTVFTAAFWRVLQRRLAPDAADGAAAPADWRDLLRTATNAVGRDERRFLYPPLEKFGALACDDDTAVTCTPRHLSAAQVKELLRFATSIDQVPRL